MFRADLRLCFARPMLRPLKDLINLCHLISNPVAAACMSLGRLQDTLYCKTWITGLARRTSFWLTWSRGLAITEHSTLCKCCAETGCFGHGRMWGRKRKLFSCPVRQWHRKARQKRIWEDTLLRYNGAGCAAEMTASTEPFTQHGYSLSHRNTQEKQ